MMKIFLKINKIFSKIYDKEHNLTKYNNFYVFYGTS